MAAPPSAPPLPPPDFSKEVSVQAPQREDQFFTLKSKDKGLRQFKTMTYKNSHGGAKRDSSSPDVDRRMSILGRLDPDIEAISRWADENPKAMWRLLNDPVLRNQLFDAMRSFGCAPEVEQRSAENMG